MNAYTCQECFSIADYRFHWPLFSHYVNVSQRNGSTTKVLTIDEAYTLIELLITTI